MLESGLQYRSTVLRAKNIHEIHSELINQRVKTSMRCLPMVLNVLKNYVNCHSVLQFGTVHRLVISYKYDIFGRSGSDPKTILKYLNTRTKQEPYY